MLSRMDVEQNGRKVCELDASISGIRLRWMREIRWMLFGMDAG